MIRAEHGLFGHPLHGAGVRDDDEIVLIGALDGKALGRKHPHDLEGLVANAEGLTDRRPLGEELRGDGLPDNADLAHATNIGVREHVALGKRPQADAEVVGALAQDLGGPIEPVGEHLGAGANFRTECGRRGYLPLDGLGVIDREGAGAERAAAGAALVEVAGKNQQNVLPKRGDLGFDHRFRPVANAHHRDDRADADDDAERREDGAHGVAAQRAEGNRQSGADAHEGRNDQSVSLAAVSASRRRCISTAATFRLATWMSLTTRPSRMMRFRLQKFAMSSSWVTMTMVIPWSLSF